MPSPRRPSVLAYGGLLLALLGLLWTAATQWQHLQDRVTALEREQTYLHGTFEVPKGTR